MFATAITWGQLISLSAVGTLLSALAGYGVARAQARKTNAEAGSTVVDAAERVVTMTVTRFEAATHNEAICQQKVERLEQYVEVLAQVIRASGIPVPPIPPMKEHA